MFFTWDCLDDGKAIQCESGPVQHKNRGHILCTLQYYKWKIPEVTFGNILKLFLKYRLNNSICLPLNCFLKRLQKIPFRSSIL